MLITLFAGMLPVLLAYQRAVVPSACARAGVQMLIPLGQRSLHFNEIDESSAVAFLRSFPTQSFSLWANVEWRRTAGTDKLQFGTRVIDNGVRMIYYLSDKEKRDRGLGGSPVEDGGLEIFLDMNAR